MTDRHSHDDRHSLEHIARELKKLAEQVHHMSHEVAELRTQVNTTIALETHVIALLKGGGGGLPASDLAQVIVLSGQLKASSDALAAALGGAGGTGTETTDVQSLSTSGQQAVAASGDPSEVSRLVAIMEVNVSSLSGAFTRNTPPLPSPIVQQEVAALAEIAKMVSNLRGSVNDPGQVTTYASQIHDAATSLAAIIAANPRSPVVARRR